MISLISTLMGIATPKHRVHIGFRSLSTGKMVAGIDYLPRSYGGTCEGAYKLNPGWGESNPCFSPMRVEGLRGAFERRFQVNLNDVSVEVHGLPGFGKPSEVEIELKGGGDVAVRGGGRSAS